eukprot:15470816-Alexandrium_andersonii.AAC.1
MCIRDSLVVDLSSEPVGDDTASSPAHRRRLRQARALISRRRSFRTGVFAAVQLDSPLSLESRLRRAGGAICGVR